MAISIDRRGFVRAAAATGLASIAPPQLAALAAAPQRARYSGPNVVIIRFGGGVRRRETIDPQHTFAPYLRHQLISRGTLFPRMEISSLDGIATSHAQGTLYTLTGKYEKYSDTDSKLFGSRFEASVPTLFEYLRKSFDVPAHRALIVNGEDRLDEEFLTFGNHHAYGVRYRSEVLSLYRYKTHLLRRKIAAHEGTDKELAAMARKLEKLESVDYRRADTGSRQVAELESFWDGWRRDYRDSGLINARGDRLLTELALRALRDLRPALLMINLPGHRLRSLGQPGALYARHFDHRSGHRADRQRCRVGSGVPRQHGLRRCSRLRSRRQPVDGRAFSASFRIAIRARDLGPFVWGPALPGTRWSIRPWNRSASPRRSDGSWGLRRRMWKVRR